MGAMAAEPAERASTAPSPEPFGDGPDSPCAQDPLAALGEPEHAVVVPSASTEVFVGGLPSDATDEAVAAAFAKVGTVLAVRLTRRKRGGECKGFGFVKYGDQSTAERACVEVKEVCGKPVGVHTSRGRAVDEAFEASGNWPVQEAADPEASINKLLFLLRSHSDKRSAVEAALKAVHAIPTLQGSSEESLAEAAKNRNARPRLEVDVPDPATLIDAFPHCKRLLDTFRASPNTQNKTPLAILHEYATRFTLELVYEEKSDSALGPFTSEAKLTSVGGAVLYAKGTGRGRGKKDAKQVAAAALLEELLKSVDMSEFLQPGKSKQQLPFRVALHPSLLHLHRAQRGRPGGSRGGYMRALARGYYPPHDYAPCYYPPPHYVDLPPHPDAAAGYHLGRGGPPESLPRGTHYPPHHPSQAPGPQDLGDPLAGLHMASRGMAPELLQRPGLQDALMHDTLPPPSTTFGLTDPGMQHRHPEQNGFAGYPDYHHPDAGRQLASEVPPVTRAFASHLTTPSASSSLIGLTSPLTANGLGGQFSQYQQF